MKTVHEVSMLTGVSIRTLRYYDKIGLLCPAKHTQAGYRLYDDSDLEVLQQILLFRELEFSLKDIQKIIKDPHFDREKALDQQITLLRMKKEHLDKLISNAEEIKSKGVIHPMDFSAFDTSKIEAYTAEAKAQWGHTDEYAEYEEKSKNRAPEENERISSLMMHIFAEIGAIKDQDPAGDTAQALVQKLKDFISEHFYTCSDRVLAGLGQMYTAGGEMTGNIDRAGGKGTAAFAAKAIEAYCSNK